MKKSNFRYFAEASDNTNAKHLNLTGFADEYANFDSELLSADASPAQTNANAATAAPYIVSVTNNTTANVSNVFVLGANQNLPANITNYGNPTSVTITMGSGTITYGQFLFQTLTQPFTVGLTYLQSSNTQQVLSTFTLQHIDSGTGRLASDPIVPLLDPYQNLNTMVIVRRLFTCDGNAMLTFATLYASATLNVYLFPSNTVSIRRGIAGGNVEVGYGNPKIVMGQNLNISPNALAALKG